MGMKVSELDFVRLLPAFMQDDEAVIALSKSMNQLLGEPSKRLATIRTWDKIDELNEAECDELAWELDIDWYDAANMSLEDKRETIKIAQQIKRKRGTKWAVERLITAYFGEGYVLEWFEKDNAAPYTFEVLTTNTQVIAENYDKFLEAVIAAKNERSHMVGVFYLWQQGPDPGIEYAMGSSIHQYDFKKCGEYPQAATVGFIVRHSVETEPEEEICLYAFDASGTRSCSDTDPKKCHSLVDITTGRGYILSVAAGKLTMEATTGPAAKNYIFFADTATGETYSLYVSGGKLTMEATGENVTASEVVFDDTTTGEKYILSVAAGKLTMKSETEQ